MKKMAFIIPPTVELLDLSGPAQVFTEAKEYGMELEMEFYQFSEDPVSTAGLGFGKLAGFKTAKLKAGDFVFVPGMDNEYVNSISFKAEREFFNWLKECSDRGITVCSICTGAFALGHAGLLRDTECTTHWRRVEELQMRFPTEKVLAGHPPEISVQVELSKEYSIALEIGSHSPEIVLLVPGTI